MSETKLVICLSYIVCLCENHREFKLFFTGLSWKTTYEKRNKSLSILKIKKYPTGPRKEEVEAKNNESLSKINPL